MTLAFMGAAQVHAATYDPTTHLITLNNVQGLNKNTPTFNTAVNLQTSDSETLHKGQTYKIANTSAAIGNSDARYTVEDSKLFIPNLVQDAAIMMSATLQITNPINGELTVLEVITTSLGNTPGTPGLKGDTGSQGPAGANGKDGKDGAPGSFPAGTAIGDMQYWDGVTWAMVPAGSNGSYLVFCDGKPTWGTCKTTPTPLPSSGYKIGDTGPAGGIVFYVDASLAHGLEAQPADYNNRQTKSVSDAIIACTSYGSGWHLPTKEEFNRLYQYKDIVGGFANDLYWSSTGFDGNHAWFQDFSNGSQYYALNAAPLLVRAVRAF